ncbi:MAG: hypothetical protein ACLPUO_15920, partial [Streptosporangiaceae bacterium]
MFHCTEHNIRVHVFTCVLALQIAHLMRRQAGRAGLDLSVRELLRKLVPCQATFARLMMRRSRSSWAWVLRQMMYRRIMLPCSLWVA